MRLILAIGLVALLTAGAGADNERALSVGAGWATFSVPVPAMGDMEATTASPDVGGSVSVSYERTIGTDFALRGELAVGVFHGGNDEQTGASSQAVLADIGVGYRFDILRVVPYAFAGVGAIAARGGRLSDATDLVLVIGGGIDHLFNRHRSLGLELRLASFAGDVTVATIGVRGTMRWGAF